MTRCAWRPPSRPRTRGCAVLAPVREWNLKNLADKLRYARNRGIPIDEPGDGQRHGRSQSLGGEHLPVRPCRSVARAARGRLRADPSAEKAPDAPAIVTIGFDAGTPCSLDGKAMPLLPLVRELNRIGGEHGIGRSDVVEDRMFGIKSREFYEAPTPTLLLAAHRELQSLVHSREMINAREILSRRYAELVYMGLWFHDLRRALQGFFHETQRLVTGEVRLKLYKGSLHRSRPAEPAQPVRQPAGEPVEPGVLREPVGAGLHVAVDAADAPGGSAAGRSPWSVVRRSVVKDMSRFAARLLGSSRAAACL